MSGVLRLLGRLAKWLGIGLAGVVVLVLVVFGALQTPPGQDLLADVVTDLAASPDFALEIEEIRGFVPVDMTVASVRLRDRDGVWLRLDDLQVAWDPLALLGGTASIQLIEAARLTVDRPPAPGASEVEEPAPAEPFALPSLPLAVDLDRLHIDSIALADAVIGEPVIATLTASGRLGDLGEDAVLSLALARTDAVAMRADLDVRFNQAAGLLTLNGLVAEPPGGMIAAALGRPDLPAVEVVLSGDGTLDDWQGNLTAAVGDVADVTVLATIQADGAGRRALADLTGDVTYFLPAPVDALVGSDPMVSIDAVIGADGVVVLNALGVRIDGADLRAQGRFDPAASAIEAMVRVDVAPPTDALQALIGPVDWRAVSVDLTATGPADQPDLDVAVQADGLVAEGVGVDRVDLAIAARPDDALTQPEARIELSVRTDVSGLTGLPEEALGVIGPSPTVTFAGPVRLDGTLEDFELALTTAVATVMATGSAEGWGQAGVVEAAVNAPDLALLADPLGQPIRGALAIAADGRWGTDGVDLGLAAQIDDAATGIGPVDAVLAEGATLDADVAIDGAGQIADASMTLNAGPVSATATPDLAAQPQAIDWTLAVGELATILPDQVSGAIDLSGRVDDPLGTPAVAFTLTSDRLIAAGRSIDEAAVTGTVQLDGQDVAAAVRAALMVDGLPVTLDTDTTVTGGAQVTVETLNAGFGDLTVTGSAVGSVNGTGSATVQVAGPVGALTAILGVPVSATLDLAGEVSTDGAGIDGTLGGTVASLQAPDASVDVAELQVSVTGDLEAPALDARLTATGIAAGSVALTRAEVAAQGTPAALSVTLGADAPDMSAEAAATIAAGPPLEIGLTALAGRYQDVPIALQAPARIVLDAGDVVIDGLVLTVDGGRVAVSGRAGNTLNTDVTVTDLPLAIARAAAPDLALTGTAAATVAARGTPTAPEVAFDLTIAGGGLADAAAGVPTVDVTASGQLQGDQASLTLAAEPNTGGALQVDGQTDLATGGLAIALTGGVDLGSIPVLAAQADRVDGRLDVDLTVGGNLDQPEAGGTITITDGAYVDEGLGVAVSDVSARIVGDQSDLRVEAFSAVTPGGGTLSATGAIGLAAEAGLPLQLALTGRDAVVLNREDVIANLDLDLTVDGQLNEAIALGGTIAVNRIDILIPEQLPVSLPVIAVEEINPPPPHCRAPGTGARGSRRPRNGRWRRRTDRHWFGPGDRCTQGRLHPRAGPAGGSGGCAVCRRQCQRAQRRW